MVLLLGEWEERGGRGGLFGREGGGVDIEEEEEDV